MRVGVDAVSVERIAALLQRFPRFAERAFSAEELRVAAGKPARLASRWAAKEAVRKLLAAWGAPLPAFRDIEVVGGGVQPTGIRVRGEDQRIALSLSHDAGIAVAVAVGRHRGRDAVDAPDGLRLPARPGDANKGTFGRVVVVAGARGYTGAPQLAALGGARTGAGLVTVCVPETIYPIVAGRCLEVMPAPLPDAGSGALHPDGLEELQRHVQQASAVVVGPGLGRADATRDALLRLLESLACPAVVDADGLNLAASAQFEWQKCLQPVVLTPHPAEMGRLAGLSTAEVQRDRRGLAERYAAEHGVALVLKGSETVVAAAGGRLHLDQHRVVALATGGTGDVLGGMIAAFMAQGLDPFDAAVAGVTVHAEAGLAVQARQGRAGALASDVIGELPRAQERLRRALERKADG